ncbi:MAG TPA: hypothetical protein VKS78_20415 [Roseiarcus sp.]|nr:hypothetical protein [Roseiarcus sp.]
MMSDQTFKELRHPTQCELWEKPELVATKVSDRFETVESFVDESHLSRALLKCRECGQLYFFEFYENVDWKGGDDAQYSTYIPVEDRSDIETMKEGSIYDLFYFTPRLQWDHKTDAPGSTVKWIGK